MALMLYRGVTIPVWAITAILIVLGALPQVPAQLSAAVGIVVVGLILHAFVRRMRPLAATVEVLPVARRPDLRGRR